MSDVRARGHVEKFLLARATESDVLRFDLELVLAESWENNSSRVTLRASDVRSPDYKRLNGFDVGAYRFLAINDISGNQWEGLKFEIYDIEDSDFSFYCRDFVVT